MVLYFTICFFFSGYSFIPFNVLEQSPSFHLNETIYNLIHFFIDAKFYTLFSILFAAGFYYQFSKNKTETCSFLKTYHRKTHILLLIGLIHSLIWFGDILLTFALIMYILILFKNVQKKSVLRWSLFFILIPFLIDLVILPFLSVPDTINSTSSSSTAHIFYPDMSPEIVMNTFQNGTLLELFLINIHNVSWKYVGYLPSGKFLIFLGIFLFGYYLALIHFFTRFKFSILFMLSSLFIGFGATLLARFLGGNSYQFPPTLPNILYKLLAVVGQIFMCLFYIIIIIRLGQTSLGKRVFSYLIPVGRMTLSNYLFQTLIMILIFYNFGFNLIGRIGLISVTIIVLIIVLLQIIISNIWLTQFKFGLFEWIWRCLIYKRKLKLKLDNTL